MKVKNPKIILRSVWILDTEVESLSVPMDVYVVDGIIAEIGESIVVGDGVIEIDCSGKFALPGLIDAHAHPFLAETNISRLRDVPPTLMAARAANIMTKMLLRGFTTIRDATGADWGIKKAVEEGEIVGPRLFIAGRALSQTGGHGDFRNLTESNQEPCQCAHALAYTSRIADGVDEVVKAVRDELRLGADQIKIMVSGGVSSPHDPLECDQYSPEEIKAIVAEARKRNTYVMAHAYGASAIRMALENGVRTIEHGNLIDEDAAKLAAEKNAYIVPTLVTYDVLATSAVQNNWSPMMLKKLAKVREAGLNSIRICKANGVKLGFGTDLLGDSFDHQSREFSIRSEVETPRETIRSATRINAEILQQTGRLGEISEGAIADILVLDANPMEDVKYLLDDGAFMPVIMKQGTVVKNTLST